MLREGVGRQMTAFASPTVPYRTTRTYLGIHLPTYLTFVLHLQLQLQLQLRMRMHGERERPCLPTHRYWTGRETLRDAATTE